MVVCRARLGSIQLLTGSDFRHPGSQANVPNDASTWKRGSSKPVACLQRSSTKKAKKLVQKKSDTPVKLVGSKKANKLKMASVEAGDAANAKVAEGVVGTGKKQLKEAHVKGMEKKVQKEKKRKLANEEQGTENEDEDADGESSPKETKKLKKQASLTTDLAKSVTAEEFGATHKILVSTDKNSFKCPPPMVTFDSTPYDASIRSALDEAGYNAPTPTQAQSWPIALSGRNVITVARTGSGKTLGFLLPAFHSLLQKPDAMRNVRGAGPYVVVLAPTRELACQINEEAVKFGQSSGIRTTTVYGELRCSCLVSLTVSRAQGRRAGKSLLVCWSIPVGCPIDLGGSN